MSTKSVRIIMEERNNIMLTCGIQYVYPSPTIKWGILEPLTNEYTQIQKNTTNYNLLSNGSVELLHRFLFEMGYMIVMCSVTNVYGSGETTFNLWEHETFMRSKCMICIRTYLYKLTILIFFASEQEFNIYIHNIVQCEDLQKVYL